jgi:alkylhydroperoxidase family enzyme/catechol 2,3-dioxygenase-like lactoylglutathione lyase family enzyme
MPRLPIHTLDSAPATGRPVLDALAGRSPSGQPLNLHAQMAHAPAVLLGYMGLRRMLDEHAHLERTARTAILLTVAAADGCAYSLAVNTLVAQQSGWGADDIAALRNAQATDEKLAALLRLARQSALHHGHVDEATWQSARAAGWTETDLAETFALIGLAQYVDSFVNFAQTPLDPALAPFSAAPPLLNGTSDVRLTHLLIVEDQDRTRAFYEQVLGAQVVRARDPVILQFHNSWIVANAGGPPTDDKPSVTMAPPSQPNLASYALNVRVPDARATYDDWRSRGAHFLTPPVDFGGEIRCYLRDPDGHLIELGQSVAPAASA